MDIFYSLNPSNSPISLTIGNFDGVHIGHQAILRKVVQVAKKNSYKSAVMTFFPHPKVFWGEAENFLISSNEEKQEHILNCGIDALWNIPFNKDFSKIFAQDFIDYLINQLNVKYLLIGDDFRFGYQGRGDFQLLEDICRKYNITVEHTPTISYENIRVSSSRVRDAILANDFELVKALLGRPLCYRGVVVRGRQLGRTIDFPTANISLPKEQLLPSGVFVVKVKILGDNNVYLGMCNIGTKPTVSADENRQIETHLFDFNDGLYDKEIHIEPIAKIRDEQKFSSVEELMQQLKKDKEYSINLLNSLSKG